MFDLYTAVTLMTLFILTITIADVVTNRLITKATKVKSVIACLLIAVSALGECVGVLTNGASASFLLLHKLAKVTEYCFAPAIGVAAAIAYGDAKKSRFAIALVAVHALFECIAAHFEWVFRIDAQNIYHRQELYLVYAAAFIFSVSYGIISIIRNGKAYQVGVDVVLILTLAMLIVGIGLHFVYSGIRIDFLCIAIGNMLFYVRYYKIMLQVDAVTLLFNRRCYDTNISDMGSRAMVLLFDIDKFKAVNDTYGHSTGDLCLKTVAQQLKLVYGKHGQCYRIGGDEFCVILHGDQELTEELNRRFVCAIEAMQTRDSRMPGVSLGYAYYDAAVSHIQDVIEEADAMLYRNKHMR